MNFDFEKYRDSIEALHESITNTTIAVLEMVSKSHNLDNIETERLKNLITKAEALLEEMVEIERYEQAARLKASLDVFKRTRDNRYEDSTEKREEDDPTVSGSH